MILFVVRPRITIISLTMSMREWDVVLAPYKRDLSEKKRGAPPSSNIEDFMDSYRRVIPICDLYVICQFILIRSGVNM